VRRAREWERRGMRVGQCFERVTGAIRRAESVSWTGLRCSRSGREAEVEGERMKAAMARRARERAGKRVGGAESSLVVVGEFSVLQLMLSLRESEKIKSKKRTKVSLNFLTLCSSIGL
jgi:hypothetical protein